MANEWVKDNRGNKCSVKYFCSVEKAQAALDSLSNCTYCTNCAHCENCTYCSNCSNCTYCSNCLDSSNCTYCTYCKYCSGCSQCSYCSNCTYCSYCTFCSDCSDCSGCSQCSDCSNCSGCSKYSDCSNCSGCSKYSDCSGCSEFDGKKTSNIVIPTIVNIDRAIYDAITLTGHLDMSNWHSCETTHCRAGFVVHLAGENGYALEKKFHNTELAAMLIYRESGSPINPARFYDSNHDAMADIKKRAGITE